MRPQPAGVEIDGDELRSIRKQAGFDIVTFAAKCNISAGYLSQIEVGRRPTVSPRVFVRICDALEIPADERDRLIRANRRAVAA